MTANIGKLDTRVAVLASAPSSWHGYDFPILDDGDETTPTSIRCSAVAQLIGADYTVKVLRAADVTEKHVTGDAPIPVINGAHMVVTPMPELCGRDEDGDYLCPNPELDADVLDEYEARLDDDADTANAYWNLGKCGDTYVPIQNMDLCALLDTFLDACTEYAQANPDSGLTLPRFETMGTLDNRRRFWAQVTLGGFGVALSDKLAPVQEPSWVVCVQDLGGRYMSQPLAKPDAEALCQHILRTDPIATVGKFEAGAIPAEYDSAERMTFDLTAVGSSTASKPQTDDVVAYLLVTTSHDGRYAAQVSIVFVRVVCNNTLNAAMDTEDRVFTIKHVGDVQMKVTNASRGIEWLVKTMRDEKARLESYATTYLTDDDARLLCRAFFGFSARQDWLSDRAIRLYIDDSADAELLGNDTAPTGTVYRLLQALTQTIEETQAGKDADAEAARISSATARVSGEYRGRGFTPTAANALCASVVARYDEVIASARKDADAEHQKRLAAELKRQEKAAAKETT